MDNAAFDIIPYFSITYITPIGFAPSPRPATPHPFVVARWLVTVEDTGRPQSVNIRQKFSALRHSFLKRPASWSFD
jgi:hypothetical protein